MKVAFLGTGLMGRPMAERLLQAGYRLHVYNRTPEKALPLEEKGARLWPLPEQAVREAEMIVLMLSDFAAIEAVLLREELLKQLAGKTVIQMGTILPEESRRLQEIVLERGGNYLEAPVLGSIPQAKSGELIVMVGGDEALFQRWRKLLACFGSEVHLVGEVGKAATLKLALNQLIASLTAAFSLSLGMVLRSGVEVELFMSILRNSALYAPTFDKKLPRMLKRDFDRPNFPTKHLFKDVKLVEETARRLGLETAGVEGVRHIIEKALQMGWSETDYSSLYNAVNPPQEKE